MLRKLALFAIMITSAKEAVSQPMQLEYRQDIEMYHQDWTIKYIQNDLYPYDKVLYIFGDGKLGAFAGLLDMNCATPRNSSWIWIGAGYTTRVPADVIDLARKVYC